MNSLQHFFALVLLAGVQAKSDSLASKTLNFAVDPALTLVRSQFNYLPLANISADFAAFGFPGYAHLTHGKVGKLSTLMRDGDSMMITKDQNGYEVKAKFALKEFNIAYNYEVNLMNLRESGKMKLACSDFTLKTTAEIYSNGEVCEMTIKKADFDGDLGECEATVKGTGNFNKEISKNLPGALGLLQVPIKGYLNLLLDKIMNNMVQPSKNALCRFLRV